MQYVRRIVWLATAASFLVLGMPLAEDTRSVLWVEESEGAPIRSTNLQEFCEDLRAWQLGEMSPAARARDVALPSLRFPDSGFAQSGEILLTINYQVERESSSDYWGLLSTGELNDGIRVEMGRDQSVALLVEAPELGENSFRAVSLSPAPSALPSDQEVWFSIDLSEPPGGLQSSTGRIDLPTLREESCVASSVGVGFSDDRIFPGTVTVSASFSHESRFGVLSRVARGVLPFLLIVFLLVEIVETWWTYRRSEN